MVLCVYCYNKAKCLLWKRRAIFTLWKNNKKTWKIHHIKVFMQEHYLVLSWALSVGFNSPNFGHTYMVSVTFWVLFCYVFKSLVHFCHVFSPVTLSLTQVTCFLFHSCTSSPITSPQYLVSRFPAVMARSSPCHSCHRFFVWLVRFCHHSHRVFIVLFICKS